MQDFNRIAVAVPLTDAVYSPASKAISDINRALYSPEAVPEAVAERMDDATVRNPLPQPFIQCPASTVRFHSIA